MKNIDFSEKISNIIIKIEILLLVLTLSFPITGYGIEISHASGRSMEPTFKGSGVAVAYKTPWTKFQKNDIVTIKISEDLKEKYPETLGDGSGLLKRIVGIPGDTIEVKAGLVYINGKLHNDFDYQDTESRCWWVNVPEYTLDKNEYFVMGDNYAHSGDSRFYGPFKEKDLSKLIFSLQF